MLNEIFWLARRDEICLKPDVTNLNAGSCSPTCLAALDAVLRYQRELAEDPVEFVFRKTPKIAETARRTLAAALGCAEPGRIALVGNASFAVNTVLKSLPFERGDVIVTTDQEYHHYDPIFSMLKERKGVAVHRITLPLGDSTHGTPDAILAAFAAACTSRTRALFFSHVTSATGTTLPAARLCELARQRGLLSIVDGAHAPGLVDVTLKALDPDFYTANIHKWLMGAVGSAFLYVRPARRRMIAPLITMGPSAFDWQRADTAQVEGGPSGWCFSHEYQGTRNASAILAIPEALAFRMSLPEPARRDRTARLAEFCRERLTSLGYVAASPRHPELATCMVAFYLPKNTPRIDSVRAWAEMRKRHSIEVALPHLGDGTPLLRVSNAWFNTESEIDRLATVLATWRWQDFAV
jgi:isopenicillin-N epimerase